MTIGVWKKGIWYIAKSHELDFVSQGKSPEEAKKNLLEVVEIQFEEMSELGTLEDYLQECGYKVENDIAIPMSEMIGFERHAYQINR